MHFYFLTLHVGAPAQRRGCCEESRRGQSARVVGDWYRIRREQVRYALHLRMYVIILESFFNALEVFLVVVLLYYF